MKPDKISHTQSMVTIREGSQTWESHLKHNSRIPINPAILAVIGHRFIAKKKKKTKNADGVGLKWRAPRPEMGYFFGLINKCFIKAI